LESRHGLKHVVRRQVAQGRPRRPPSTAAAKC
jgi:hypothetical protein